MTQKGFTLIEIMITVAILGILSAIVLPSYTEHVKKGKRSDAKVELLRLAQMQESYFVQNLSYAKDLTQLGFGANTIPTDNTLYAITTDTITPVGCNPLAATPVACTGFKIKAQPYDNRSQIGDLQCLRFTIDNVGRRTAGSGTVSASTITLTGNSTGVCWN
jgi:type IV pilus assembly protein PilE